MPLSATAPAFATSHLVASPPVTDRRCRRVPATLPLVAVSTLLALAACASDDGRGLPPPRPDQTQSVLTTSTVAADEGGLVLGEVDPGAVTTNPNLELALTVPWEDDGPIDPKYTCSGADVSPAIAWSNVPDGTVEIAFVFTDLDAGDFVHWVVTGLDPALGSIAEGAPPLGAIQAINDFGALGYRGPCPNEPHSYLLQVFAVGQQIELGDGAPAADLITAIESAAISTRTHAGVYPAP
jgi:Raf kinase inhibitor-like YbhB/YbcL family protein